MTQSDSVFSGEYSMLNYLDPRNHITPLTELHYLPGFSKTGVRVFIKDAPFKNIKTIPARHMLEQKRMAGKLEGVHTLIECSSGGMASALADLYRHYGIERFVAVIANDTASGRKEELNMKGVSVVYENDIPESMSMTNYARQQGRQSGWLNLDQYENTDNPESYEKWFAPQIYEQLCQSGLGNHPLIFCAPMGTCGTILGNGKYFKEHHPDCRVVGVKLAPGKRVPGIRDEDRLQRVGLYQKYIVKPMKIGSGCVVDELVSVETYSAYKRALSVIHTGFDFGLSSGAGLEGGLTYLAKCKGREEVILVVIALDGYKLYATDKITTVLDGNEFINKVPPSI